MPKKQTVSATAQFIKGFEMTGLLNTYPSFNEKNYIDDLIKYNLAEDFTFQGITLWNRTASIISALTVMGMPLKADTVNANTLSSPNYTFVVAGQEAQTIALLLHMQSFGVVTLAVGGSIKTKALARGPAIINQNQIPLLDVNGAALNIALIVSSLYTASYNAIVPNTQPTVTATQTN